MNILIPSSTDHNSRVVRFKLESKNTIAMPMFIPELSFKVMTSLLGFLIVYSDDVVSSGCCKVATIVSIVESKDLIIRLDSVP